MCRDLNFLCDPTVHVLSPLKVSRMRRRQGMSKLQLPFKLPWRLRYSLSTSLSTV